jgi:hypothetical protein
LLDVYGITDPTERERLTEDARASRRQRYVIKPEYREHLSPGLIELMQFEKEAVAIHAFQPVVYPGVLQTTAVSEAMAARWFHADETRRVQVEARMSRRNQVIERADGPDYSLILDESVLKRRFGGTGVTAEQLEDIVRVAQRPNVHIRVLPFSKGYEAVAMGAFQVISLPRDDSIVYTENYRSDAVIHDHDEVLSYSKAFGEFWDNSLTEEVSFRTIADEAVGLRTAAE